MEKGRGVDFPTLLTSQVQVSRAFLQGNYNKSGSEPWSLRNTPRSNRGSCSLTLLAGSQMNNVQTGLGAVKVGADVGGK